MEKIPAKSDPAARAARRSPKVIVRGIEIPRPVIPPTIPLWRIERAVEIAVQQYADDLAARK